MANAMPDVRSVTFPAAGYHRPLTGTSVTKQYNYCLVTEAHECEQLAQGW